MQKAKFVNILAGKIFIYLFNVFLANFCFTKCVIILGFYAFCYYIKVCSFDTNFTNVSQMFKSSLLQRAGSAKSKLNYRNKKTIHCAVDCFYCIKKTTG